MEPKDDLFKDVEYVKSCSNPLFIPDFPELLILEHPYSLFRKIEHDFRFHQSMRICSDPNFIEHPHFNRPKAKEKRPARDALRRLIQSTLPQAFPACRSLRPPPHPPVRNARSRFRSVPLSGLHQSREYSSSQSAR